MIYTCVCILVSLNHNSHRNGVFLQQVCLWCNRGYFGVYGVIVFYLVRWYFHGTHLLVSVDFLVRSPSAICASVRSSYMIIMDTMAIANQRRTNWNKVPNFWNVSCGLFHDLHILSIHRHNAICYGRTKQLAAIASSITAIMDIDHMNVMWAVYQIFRWCYTIHCSQETMCMMIFYMVGVSSSNQLVSIRL